jgi:HlyD family secretion protein
VEKTVRLNVQREEAVDRLSSPEQLEQLLRVTGRKSWIAIATLGAAIAGVLVWSVVGRIPITVEGAAILIHPRQVVAFQSPGTGQIISIPVQVGGRIRKGDVIGVINQPEIARALEQERIRLAEALNRAAEVGTVRSQRIELERAAIKRKRELIVKRMDTLSRMAEAQRARHLRYIAEQERNVVSLRGNAAALGEALKERYESYRGLEKEGLSSQDSVLAARQRYVDNRVKRADIELRAQEIELSRIQAESAYLDQRDQIAQLESELGEIDVQATQLVQRQLESESKRRVEVQELRRSIERFEGQLAEQGQIVSEHDGRLLEVTVGPGQIVSSGQRLGAIEVEDLNRALIAASYFPVGEGKRIRSGMELRVTPNTVERARYGSILGKIIDVSPFAVTTEAVANVVGNQEIARLFTQLGSKIQVMAELQVDATSPSGYVWTSGRGPQALVTAGTTAEVRATIESRRPITFVIPILRDWSGVD